jgi:CheY-like chemotaxis protein
MQENSVKKINEKHRILIVEDDEDCAFTMMHVLNKDYDTEHYFTAEDALMNIDSSMFSLILMDIGLRGMNGIEALNEIRKIDKYKNVPAIAVSAYAMIGDREKFIEAGFNNYVSKPFNFSELKELVDGMLL